MSEPLEVPETLSWSPRGQNYLHNDTETRSYRAGLCTNGTKAVVGKMTGGLAGTRVLAPNCGSGYCILIITFLKKKKSVLFLNVFDETVKMNESQCLNIHHSSF